MEKVKQIEQEYQSQRDSSKKVFVSKKDLSQIKNMVHEDSQRDLEKREHRK